MKFSQFINESNIKDFTIKDIENLERKSYLSSDVKSNIEFLLEWYYDKDDKGNFVKSFLDNLNKAKNNMIKLVGKKFNYIETYDILKNALEGIEFKNDWKEYFPMTIYVSSDSNDKNTIGLEVDIKGNLKMFEGNDEATQETLKMVNDVLYGDRKITLYGSHNPELYHQMKETMTIPKGVFFSPDIKYAEKYMGRPDRNLISVEVKYSDFNQTSEYDWVATKDAKIYKLRFIK